jgi:hypothetical protein
MGATLVCPRAAQRAAKALGIEYGGRAALRSRRGPPQARSWRSRISGAPLARAQTHEPIPPVLPGARSLCSASGTRTRLNLAP